jgi:hypothetical protein
MEEKRYHAIKELVSNLHEWLDKFRESSYERCRGRQYNFACSSTWLGALTKEMDRIGLWDPRPYFPFQRLSFDGLYNSVHAMESPTWPERNGGYYGNPHPCGFQNTVKSGVDQIKDELAGLNLRDFKNRDEA